MAEALRKHGTRKGCHYHDTKLCVLYKTLENLDVIALDEVSPKSADSIKPGQAYTLDASLLKRLTL